MFRYKQILKDHWFAIFVAITLPVTIIVWAFNIYFIYLMTLPFGGL